VERIKTYRVVSSCGVLNMSDLTDFIHNHIVGAINEPPKNPKIIDVYFYKIGITGDPDKDEFMHLIETFEGRFIDRVNLFDGKEHDFMELGAWLGSQMTALGFMAIGAYFELWDVLTPNNMLPASATQEIKDLLARSGFVAIVAKERIN
jgi:hypothetical protein